MTDHERYLAIREAHLSVADAEYFNARPELDTAANRRIFYAAHCKGYDAAMESGRVPAVPPEILKYAKAMKSDGYRGPLYWAIKIINWVVEQGGEPAANKACPLCNYKHGHAIGCHNNPVDIALANKEST